MSFSTVLRLKYDGFDFVRGLVPLSGSPATTAQPAPTTHYLHVYMCPFSLWYSMLYHFIAIIAHTVVAAKYADSAHLFNIGSLYCIV